MKLLILGADGMVGHVVSLYMKERNYDVLEINENDPVLEDELKLKQMIDSGSFDAIVNCAAIINQEAEEDKVGAIKVNALLPHFLERITVGTKTVVVHRSTDCVFSGEKGNYTLDDKPDATSFYAKSKALGELINDKDITIRTSLVGPEIDEAGSGLFNWFYKQVGELSGFANAIWTGLTTIEFAKGIEWLLANKKHGLFHMVPEYAISKYELLQLFEKYYPNNRKVIKIDNKKVDKSLASDCGGFVVQGYEEQISEMKKWTDEHKSLYRY